MTLGNAKNLTRRSWQPSGLSCVPNALQTHLIIAEIERQRAGDFKKMSSNHFQSVFKTEQMSKAKKVAQSACAERQRFVYKRKEKFLKTKKLKEQGKPSIRPSIESSINMAAATQSQDRAYVALLGLAEHFRTTNNFKKAIQCLVCCSFNFNFAISPMLALSLYHLECSICV
jgi:hypothetical protein